MGFPGGPGGFPRGRAEACTCPVKDSLCILRGWGGLELGPPGALKLKGGQEVGGAGWGVVGQVSTSGTLEAQKEWKEFVLILSEWEGFLQGVEQGEVM